MATYKIDDIRIYAREEGPRNAQVALMLHGWSSSWYAMSPLLPLISRRFRCVAVDLPGYGTSAHLRQRVSIKRYAELMVGIIGELSEGPVVIIGHSMGGMIALTIALHYPHLVERMVLICPTITGVLSTRINLLVTPITQLERFRIADWLVSAFEPYMVSVTDRMMRPVSFAERSAITEDDYHRLRADARRPGQGRVRAECYWAMRENDLSGRLHEIETPALVLWGAEDNTVPLRDASIVADKYPAADLRIMPKAGHWPHFEIPAQTNRLIASYLGLPVLADRLEDSTTPSELVAEAAKFLNHSDVGTNLTLAQRMRLAAQCRLRTFSPSQIIAQPNSPGHELYIVQRGSLEIWSAPQGDDPTTQRCIASALPGQITGEMALLDGGRRSAELRAGDEGATVLILRRDRLRALVDDDPVLGSMVIWNIATTLALRLRLSNMQQQKMADELAKKASNPQQSALSETLPRTTKLDNR